MQNFAILLSAEAFSIDDIAKIGSVDRDTVSGWTDKWEQFGFKGLKDKPRSGNPGILTSRDKP